MKDGKKRGSETGDRAENDDDVLKCRGDTSLQDLAKNVVSFAWSIVRSESQSFGQERHQVAVADVANRLVAEFLDLIFECLA